MARAVLLACRDGLRRYHRGIPAANVLIRAVAHLDGHSVAATFNDSAAPWGDLAFFYRDGEHSPGLVILGRLDNTGDTERLATADRVRTEAVS